MGRRLGQHFLINKDKIKKIIGALELKNGDIVIEIGPGHGELTRQIVEGGREKEIKIIAVEKDKKLAHELSKNFQFSILNSSAQGGSASGGQSNFNFQTSKINTGIIIGDALKILPQLITQLPITNYKIVGNIPYYITGYLLRILGELEKKPSLIVLTIQKEVAQRICGIRIARLHPLGYGNTKAPTRIKGTMNILAASVQFWAEPEIIDIVPKNDFKPAPKVDSAIIKLLHSRKYADLNADQRGNYYKFIKVLFKQPRKTISNNLVEADLCGFRIQNRSGITRISEKEFLLEKLRKTGIDPNNRPQDLSMEQIVKLSKSFSQITGGK